MDSSPFLRAVGAVLWRFSVYVTATLRLLAEITGGLLGIPLWTSNRSLKDKLRAAVTYNQWKATARVIDESQGFSAWRVEESSRHYNFQGVASRIKQLAEIKRSGSVDELLQALRVDIHRATFGITNPLLYKYLSGTKSAVRTYVNLLVYLIRSVASDESVVPSVKYTALSDIARAYGNTALLLNGSVALGAYHLGVVKALHDAQLLPRIIFGCNTGALVAACICCRSDVEPILDGSAVDFTAFDKKGQSGSLRRKWNRLIHEGTLMDVSVLLQFAKDNLKEMTFLEAYHATGRILNIHVGTYLGPETGTCSWLLNYLTAPSVLVYSAAVASCATVGIYKDTPLLAKALDGRIVVFDPPALRHGSTLASFHINDALVRLRELFNVKMNIVSECSVSRQTYLRPEKWPGFVPQVVHFCLEELYRALAAVSRLKPFRCRFTGSLQNLLHNEDLGAVVVYPASSPSDLVKLLRNPDRELLHYCLWRGQQELWPFLEQVRSHVAVELAVHDALQELQALHPSCTKTFVAPE